MSGADTFIHACSAGRCVGQDMPLFASISTSRTCKLCLRLFLCLLCVLACLPFVPKPAGDIDCLAEFARTSTTAAVNDYDDEGQAALHVAADKGLTEAISILTGEHCEHCAEEAKSHCTRQQRTLQQDAPGCQHSQCRGSEALHA
jgi:hypothetical protein